MEKDNIQTTLSWPEENIFEIKVTVPWGRIQGEYQKLLVAFAKQLESHGFRKGNVPPKLAEEKIGKEKLYQQLSNQLLPLIYNEAIAKENIQAIGQPKIELVKAKEGENWELKITGYRKPQVNLAGYKEKIKTLNAQSKIWTPEKGKSPEQTAAEQQKEKEDKFQKIIATLLNNITVNIPEPMIETEVKRKMAGLIADLQKAGMSLGDYAQSQGKSVEQIQQEYRQQVEGLIKLELILEAIANQEHIIVNQEEIQQLTKNNPQVNTYILSQLLRQQKVLEYLNSL